MATYPNISLMAQTPDFNTTTQNALLSGQRFAQSVNETPYRNRLLESEATSAEQNVQSKDLERRYYAGKIMQNAIETMRTKVPQEQWGEYSNAVTQHMIDNGLGDIAEKLDLPDRIEPQMLDSAEAQLKPFLDAYGSQFNKGGSLAIKSSAPVPLSDDKGNFIGYGVPVFDQNTGQASTNRLTAPEGTTFANPATLAGQKSYSSELEKLKAQGELKPTVEGNVAASKSSEKSKEERRSLRISYGQDSAKAIPTLKRTLALLDRVETGGVDAVSLSIRRTLGIESADQGELSNKLSKAVLSQLRSTFGAQFTEKEGDRLNRIEAGIGKNTKTNKRLISELYQLSKEYAEQAIDDAVSIKDYDTAAAIKKAMSFEFDEDADLLSGGSTNTEATQQSAEQQASGFDIKRQELPPGVTEEDVIYTMKKHGVSREEVLRRFGEK